MAISIITDLIKDAIAEEQFNAANQLTYARYDRVFFVDGITGYAPDQILDVAKETVKTIVPVNTPHPRQPQALSRNYQARPVQSEYAGEVVVTFLYQFAGVPSDFVVEMDSGLEAQDTNVEWNGTKQEHIIVQFRKTWMNA